MAVSSAGPDGPDDPSKAKPLQFWNDLWQDKVDPFCQVSVPRDSNPVDGVDVPETVKVLHLPTIFPSIDDVMIRDEYIEVMRDLEGYYTSSAKKCVIILGHPGIGMIMGSVEQAWVLIYTSPYLGKTILLYYILVKRLLEEKRTVLQYHRNYLVFFDADGVKILKPSVSVDPAREEYQNAWALVDINSLVKEPVEVLGLNSPFFLIMSSSPRASRLRELQKHRRPAAYWIMKPFTLAELIQALVFLASILSFLHLCAIPVVIFNQLFTRNPISSTSLKGVDRQPVIATSPAKLAISIITLLKFVTRSKNWGGI